MPDEPTPIPEPKGYRAKVGRPRKYQEPPERRTATLPASYTVILEEIGAGSLSAGIKTIVDSALGVELSQSEFAKRSAEIISGGATARMIAEQSRQIDLGNHLAEVGTGGDLARQRAEVAQLSAEAAARYSGVVTDFVHSSDMQAMVEAAQRQNEQIQRALDPLRGTLKHHEESMQQLQRDAGLFGQMPLPPMPEAPRFDLPPVSWQSALPTAQDIRALREEIKALRHEVAELRAQLSSKDTGEKTDLR